jgi:hypothetical protein
MDSVLSNTLKFLLKKLCKALCDLARFPSQQPYRVYIILLVVPEEISSSRKIENGTIMRRCTDSQE